MSYETQKTSFRLTDTEKNILKQIAKRRNVNLSDCVRQLIMEEQKRTIAAQ